MCRFSGSQLPSSYLILHKLINSSPRARNIDLLDLGKSQSTTACEVWALKSFYIFLVYLSLESKFKRTGSYIRPPKVIIAFLMVQ